MPALGFGVFRLSPAECERCVLDAIEIGYRSIDTAQDYKNEEGVGAAIKKCGIPRDQLFITTKVWISNAGEERAALSIDESLRKLRTDYVDLLLVHEPYGDCYGTYRAMEKAYQAGKTRAIGLSNFYSVRFIDIAEHMDVKPAVLQLETHVFAQQKAMRAQGHRNKIWQNQRPSGPQLVSVTRHHAGAQDIAQGAHGQQSGHL